MPSKERHWVWGLMWLLAFAGLYLTSLYSYLLFHSLAEMFRISMAAAIFMLIWNVRRTLDNAYLMFVGAAYVFVGALDLIHTLAFQGMGVFIGFGPDLPSQLWISARYLESLSLLAASFVVGRQLKMRFVLTGYTAATLVLLATIFIWKVFPSTFAEGAGVAPFREVSEFVVSFILIVAISRLYLKRNHFAPVVFRFLLISLGFTIVSELLVAVTAETRGFLYLLGHFFRIIALYYIYRAIIETGLAKPLAVLFRNLKESENSLRRERDFSDGVLSAQDVMVAVLDREGRIVRVNKSSERILGYSADEMRSRHPWEFASPDEAEEMKKLLGENIVAPVPRRHENSVVAKDGRRLWVLWSDTFLLDEKGMVEYIIVSGVDITERKRAEEALAGARSELEVRVQERTAELARANELLRLEIAERRRVEEALRKSETKYRTVAENTYDWEWWRDPEGKFIYVSPSCKRITHYGAEEFMADPELLLRIIHPDDRLAFVKHQNEVEEKATSGEIEFRILRPDRSLRWLAHACQPVLDEKGQFLGRRGSNRDITERKRVEGALRDSETQLRYLSSRLLTAQETERRRVSRELHDELGGALAVLKLRMSYIEKHLQAGQDKLKSESRQSLQYLDQVIENVSRLSRDLSPSILEDIGLTPALHRLAENFRKNYRVQVVSDIVDVAQMLPKESQIMIYRIFQEALTNIGKHAQAKNVMIQIKREADRISFFVEDDGRGFDVMQVAARKAPEKGLGLLTMDERARMLGGTFELRSEPGRGTQISLSVPVNPGKG